MSAACMGGWCARRGACPLYRAAPPREPAERLCDPGADGFVDGLPLRMERFVAHLKNTPAGGFAGDSGR